MKNIKINKHTWYMTICEYVLIASLFFSANSVYWTSTNIYYKNLILVACLGSGVLLSVFSILKMKYIRVESVKFILIYYIILIPFAIFNYVMGFSGISSIIRILFFPILVIIYITYDVTLNKKSNIPHKIVNVGICLAIVSLLFWLLKIFGVRDNSTIQMSWGGIKNVSGLFNIQFFPQSSVNFLGVTILRNSGIYSEAPMFAFVLVIALLCHLFLEKNTRLNDRKTIILGVTLLTTTSTTGLLILLISLLLKFYSEASPLGKTVVIIAIPVTIYLVEFIIASKIENMSGSVNLRVDDIQAGFKAWLQSPIFGNGIDNAIVFQSYINQDRLTWIGGSGNSSGLMGMLSRGGLLLTSLYVFIPYILFSRKSVNNFFFCICLLVCFFVSSVDSTYMFLFLTLYMYIFSFFESNE